MNEDIKKHTPKAPFAYDYDYYIYTDKEKAENALKNAIKAIDKATSAGATKKNTAARAKSRLTKKVNSME